jgi:hypothetical protein
MGLFVSKQAIYLSNKEYYDKLYYDVNYDKMIQFVNNNNHEDFKLLFTSKKVTFDQARSVWRLACWLGSYEIIDAMIKQFVKERNTATLNKIITICSEADLCEDLTDLCAHSDDKIHIEDFNDNNMYPFKSMNCLERMLTGCYVHMDSIKCNNYYESAMLLMKYLEIHMPADVLRKLFFNTQSIISFLMNKNEPHKHPNYDYDWLIEDFNTSYDKIHNNGMNKKIECEILDKFGETIKSLSDYVTKNENHAVFINLVVKFITSSLVTPGYEDLIKLISKLFGRNNHCELCYFLLTAKDMVMLMGYYITSDSVTEMVSQVNTIFDIFILEKYLCIAKKKIVKSAMECKNDKVFDMYDQMEFMSEHIYRAVKKGDRALVKKLIQLVLDSDNGFRKLIVYLTMRKSSNDTPLIMAMNKTDLDCVKELIKYDNVLCELIEYYVRKHIQLIKYDFIFSNEKENKFLTAKYLYQRLSDIYPQSNDYVKKAILKEKKQFILRINEKNCKVMNLKLQQNFDETLMPLVAMEIYSSFMEKMSSSKTKMLSPRLGFINTCGSGPTYEWFIKSYDILFKTKDTLAGQLLYAIDDDSGNRRMYVTYHETLQGHEILAMKILGYIVAVLGFENSIDFELSGWFYHILASGNDYLTWCRCSKDFLTGLKYFLCHDVINKLHMMYDTMTDSEIENCGLYMTVREMNSTGIVTEYELIPGGKDIAITNRDKLCSYICELFTFYIEQGKRDELLYAFVTGFNMYCNTKKIKDFVSPLELYHILNADYVITPDIFLRNVIYIGLVCNKSKQLFIDYVNKCNSEYFDKLLAFMGINKVMCQSALKCNGGDVKFIVNFTDKILVLPTANTCFRKLNLPVYENYIIMKNKLELVLNEFDGYQFS